MLKNIFIIIICCQITASSFAQETKLYNPAADAEKDIAAAIKKAKAENKYVLLQGGGNWCSWACSARRATSRIGKAWCRAIRPKRCGRTAM